MTKQVRDWHKDMKLWKTTTEYPTLGWEDGVVQKEYHGQNDEDILIAKFKNNEDAEFYCEVYEALPYWLQQYAAEKERAEAAETREKKLREEMEWIKERSEIALDGDRDDSYGLAIALKDILQKSRASIYPKDGDK